MENNKRIGRMKRKLRIRKRLSGTPERPRLSMFRSLNHIYAQVIDDVNGHTLVSASTIMKDVKETVQDLKKSDAAKRVGIKLAECCLEKGIKKVVFDRGGYQYHGRIKALADGAREAGLDF